MWGDKEGNKCKIMRPRAPRGGDKCGRQVGDKCKIMRPRDWKTSVGDRWKTSVKSCGPEPPEWETSGRQVGGKCKIRRPRLTRAGDKCGRQAGDKCKSLRPRAPRRGRQVEDKC